MKINLTKPITASFREHKGDNSRTILVHPRIVLTILEYKRVPELSIHTILIRTGIEQFWYVLELLHVITGYGHTASRPGHSTSGVARRIAHCDRAVLPV